MKQKDQNEKKGSLLLIFLFSVGAFAVILAGAYFMISNAAGGAAEITKIANRQTVELAMDEIIRSEYERFSEDYITNHTTPTLTFSAGEYQTRFNNAVNWGLNSSWISALSGMNVTLPDTGSYPPFSKANPLSDDDGFSSHPLWRFRGYKANSAVTATMTPADTGKSFNYSRTYTFYKEIPVANIPFLATAAFKGVDGLYSTLAETETAFGSYPINVVLYTKGITGGSWDQPTIGTRNIGDDPYKEYPNLYTSLGTNDPLDICDYYGAAPGGNLNYQNYSWDSNAVVINFDGSSLTWVRGPATTAVPAAMTTGSFDGLTRVLIDLPTMPVSSPYNYRKWYINCTTNDAKAAGIVINDEEELTTAADEMSIATNGHVYFSQYMGGHDTPVPIVVASNYGAAGFSNHLYTGSGTYSFPLGIAPVGHFSLYGVDTDIIHDSFNRSGSLASDTPDTVNTEGLTWGSVTGSLSCTTSSDGAVVATNTTGSYCAIAVPQGCKETAAITITAGVGFSGSSTRSIRFYLAPSAINPTTDTENIMFRLDAGTTNNFTYAAHSGSTTDTDTATASVNVPSGTSATLELSYLPSIGRIIVKDVTTLPGTLIMDKRMATYPNWSGSRVPGYITLFMVAGDSSTSAAVGEFKVTKMKYGTIFHSPHTLSNDLAIMGSLTVGDQISSLMGEFGLTVAPYDIFMEPVESFTERILVNFPQFQ